MYPIKYPAHVLEETEISSNKVRRNLFLYPSYGSFFVDIRSIKCQVKGNVDLFSANTSNGKVITDLFCLECCGGKIKH